MKKQENDLFIDILIIGFEVRPGAQSVQLAYNFLLEETKYLIFLLLCSGN